MTIKELRRKVGQYVSILESFLVVKYNCYPEVDSEDTLPVIKREIGYASECIQTLSELIPTYVKSNSLEFSRWCSTNGYAYYREFGGYWAQGMGAGEHFTDAQLYDKFTKENY